AAWQRGGDTGGGDDARRTAQLDWWRAQLRDVPILDLAADRPRAARARRRADVVRFVIDAEVRAGLEALARDAGGTLFMAMLAGFQTVLSRWSGQRDIAVGTPIAGRSAHPALEDVFGMFVNTLVLRGDLTGDPSFSALLARTRERVFDAQARQDVPFEQLVAALAPARDPAVTPLFQVMLSMQNAPVGGAPTSDLRLRALPAGARDARFDLNLFVRPAQIDGAPVLRCLLEYDADRFQPESAERLGAHLRILLRAATIAPDRRLSCLPMLTDDEWRALVEDINRTATPMPHASVEALVMGQARRSPDAVAAVDAQAGVSLSYANLDGAINRMAWHLRSVGVGLGDGVGLHLGRGIDRLVMTLAVHRAGGWYLPLDPQMPTPRLASILDDARVPLVVTAPRHADALPMLPPGTRTLALDEAAYRAVSACSIRHPQIERPPSTPVYVLYTSGSTGRPKGVQVDERALVNFLVGAAAGVGPDDVLLAVTTLSFDIAGLELFLPLITGARVVIAGDDDVADGERLAALIETHGVTAMQATPMTWRLLLEAGWPRGA
ncbi:MAG: AMP-binding protein, partial [Acidobacteriota bacterium]